MYMFQHQMITSLNHLVLAETSELRFLYFVGCLEKLWNLDTFDAF